jgi:hypothetical protein
MYALIQKSDNKILKVGTEFYSLSEEKPFYWKNCPEECTVNWVFNGSTFTAPVIPEPEPYIPSVVSMRQARLALLQSGLLTTVDAAIAQGTEADKISWEYATEVNRNDALVTNLSVTLGLTDQQLDDLFVLASSL